MRSLGKRANALAALLMLIAPAAAAETAPPNLQAKPAGVENQATPSPLNLIYTPVTQCFRGTMEIAAYRTAALMVASPDRVCDVPAYAKAVLVNIAAVYQYPKGGLWVYAEGAPRPRRPTVRFHPNQSIVTSAIVSVGQTGRITAFANARVQAQVDIIGYFEPQLWAHVNSAGELVDSSGRTTSITKTGIGAYTVAFDRDVSACAGAASSDLGGRMISVQTNGNNANVSVFLHTGAASDHGFNLFLNC